MAAIAPDAFTLLLIAACLAFAGWRLAVIHWPPRGHHARSGPSYALAALSLCAALFLAIPLTLVWGLVLVAILAICHIASLRNLPPSRPA